nr:hypothetical protein [Tanacetum cinerariifolium]
MYLSPSHATVMYISMSNNDDVPSWGIPLMDAYEFDPEAHEVVPQSPNQAPFSPAYALVYLKYLAPSDDDLEPVEAQPLHASISPTALSLNYSADFKLGTYVCLSSDPLPSFIDALVDSWVAAHAPAPTLPPQSPLSPLSSTLPRIPSPPLLLPPPTHRDIIPKVDILPRKRARFTALSHRFVIGENSAAAAARQPGSALAEAWNHTMDCIRGLQDGIRKMTSTRTSMSQEALEELIFQCLADVLEAYDTNRSNGDDSHDSGSGGRRTVHTTRECTYNEFLKCQPLNFKGRGCKKTLIKLITENYCPRSEIKKLETELWNLVVKDESDKVEKYTGELPDSIQGSMMASKPKTLQEAIKLTICLMDQKLFTYATK